MPFILLLFPSAVCPRSVHCKKVTSRGSGERTRTCFIHVGFNLYFGTAVCWHYHVGTVGKCMHYSMSSDRAEVSRKESFVHPLYSLYKYQLKKHI